MDKLRQWVALTVVGALAILAAGWFLVVAPKRSDAADLRTRAAAQLSTNNGLAAKLATLKAQNKGATQKQAELAAIAARIPDNPALPSLIRSLTAAAGDSGVELVSMAPSAPAPLASAVSSTAGQSATGAAKKAAGVTDPNASAAAVGSAMTGTLEQITLALNVVGGYYQIEQFFDRVEHLTRAMKVTGFTLAPGVSPIKVSAAGATTGAPSTLTATINASVFMSAGRVSAAAGTPTGAAK